MYSIQYWMYTWDTKAIADSAVSLMYDVISVSAS